MGYWFGTTLAELVPILIGVIFYFVSVRKMSKDYIKENEHGK
jgi:hypothetical protein